MNSDGRSQSIHVRDERLMPFATVPLAHLEAAGKAATGADRVQLLGLVVRLNELVNAARNSHSPERFFVSDQASVAAELGISRDLLRKLTRLLSAAKVLTMTTIVEPDGRMLRTRYELIGQAVPAAHITLEAIDLVVSMGGRKPLPLLGFYVTLIHEAFEQRDGSGRGSRASITREELAERLGGISKRTVDSYSKDLVELGLIDRVTVTNDHGTYDPTVWVITEPSRWAKESSRQAPCKLSSGTVQDVALGGAGSRQPPCKLSPGGAATCTVLGEASCASREGDVLSANTEDQHPLPSLAVSADVQNTAGDPDLLSSEEAFCRALAQSAERRAYAGVADEPDGWNADRAGWLAAAAEIFAKVDDLDRLLSAIEVVELDSLLSGKVFTAPVFARSLRDILGRQASMVRRREQFSAKTDARDEVDVVIAVVRQATGTFGRKRKAEALAHLAMTAPGAVALVEQAGWAQLCTADDFATRQLLRAAQTAIATQEAA